MKKRLLSILLVVCTIATILPTFGGTAFAADTVTRSEWISRLVEAFSMTVESDDNMPDNYFSDLTEDDPHYRDILVAVEFGVIDLEAGEAFEPDAAATREFAAQTLNSCLMFQLDEGAEYTYSEADRVTYPDDIQIAVNRGWFALSGKSFLPEQAVTAAEADAMIADSAAVLASKVIDENHENKCEFAEGVIEIPETVNAVIDADNTVTITDYDAQISEGDVFVAYSNGLPIALKALNVENSDNTIIITSTSDGTDNAILSMDLQGVADIDLENVEAPETVTYQIYNTTQATPVQENMDVVLAGFNYDKKTKTLNVSEKIKIGNSAAGTISATLSNLQLKYNINTAKQNYSVIITADTNVTVSASFDFSDYAGIPSNITLCAIPIDPSGVSRVELSADIAIDGGISMAWDGKLKAGFTYTERDGFSLEREYKKTEFSFTAEVNIKVGLNLSAGVYVKNILSAYVYGTVGVKMTCVAKGYDSGTPKLCEDTKAYMYATIGANADILNHSNWSKKKEIYNENNSPVRVHIHYEDSLPVDACTRGQNIKYTTKPTSKYYNPGPNHAQSSYGGGSSGGSGGSGGGTGSGSEPVVIWEYELDDDNNATITGYHGGASAIAIPSKIDGYTVTKIGDSAFKNNKIIHSVTIPNTVITIGNEAFENCTSLSSISLSKNLVTLGYNVFCDCTALTSIEIPKSLENTGASRYIGTFAGTGLKDVTFEDGITQIPDNLFQNCQSLEYISLPDTIISIGNEAFYNCTSLSNVMLSKNLESLGYNVFCGCTNLTTIEIPKSLENTGASRYIGTFAGTSLKSVTFEEGITKIPDNLFQNCQSLEYISLPDTIISVGSNAFKNCSLLKEVILPNDIKYIGNEAFCDCTNLSNIKLPKSLEKIGYSVFSNCIQLTEIEIPKSLTYANHPFGNSGLQTVTFEKGTSKVVSDLFGNAYNLKKVTLLNTMTSIGNSAFQNCSSLKQISIPDTVTKINSSTFEGCSALTDITIPSSITEISDSAFKNCSSLREIKLPDSVTKIGSNCFANSGLEKIVLPPTLQEITSGLFNGCKSLNDVTIPSAVKYIRGSAFTDCTSLSKIDLPNSLLDIGLTEITVPESVTGIGGSAFYNCDNLKTVTIKGSGRIYENVFGDCDALTDLTISDQVTSIGDRLCYSCDNLINVKLGNAITTIPSEAFRQCSMLAKVQLPRFCTTVEANAFAEDVKLTDIYIPTSVTSIQTNSISYPNRTTGHGKSGSYGQAYANERGMNFEAVNAPITSIKYADSSMSIGRNATVRPQLNIEPAFDTSVVTFSTSDDKILTVSDTGLVRGVNYGTATITATADSGKSTSIEITVLKTATKLELDKSSLSLEQGQSDTLSVTMTPSDAADKLNWSSSNSEVATVDENGKITAVGVGTAVITVTAEYSSVSASCTVEVIKKATITASAGEHGKILPLGDASFPIGENATFNIIPDYGYVIKDVTVNGASVGAVESYTFSNISDNATIHAEFAAVNVSYGNGDVVISSEAALNNLTLIIAEYNSDNSLSNCEVRTITAEPNAEQHVSVSPTGKYKIMLWSGFDIMRPIWMYQG